MAEVYYVVLVDGIPEAVTTLWAMAEQYVTQFDSTNREAVIVPTRAIEGPEESDRSLL